MLPTIVGGGGAFAIVLDAGSDTWAENARPVNYPDGNVVRDVQVAGNSVSGSLAAGVRIQAGVDAGGSHNRVESVRVEHNLISSMLGKGVYLWVGQISPYEGMPATGNRIAGGAIDANQIAAGNGTPQVDTDYRTAGAIVLLGGDNYGHGGVIRDVRISENRITTARTGIRLIGGLGSTAQENSVVCVRLAGNRIRSFQTLSVQSNVSGAFENQASLRGC